MKNEKSELSKKLEILSKALEKGDYNAAPALKEKPVATWSTKQELEWISIGQLIPMIEIIYKDSPLYLYNLRLRDEEDGFSAVDPITHNSSNYKRKSVMLKPNFFNNLPKSLAKNLEKVKFEAPASNIIELTEQAIVYSAISLGSPTKAVFMADQSILIVNPDSLKIVLHVDPYGKFYGAIVNHNQADTFIAVPGPWKSPEDSAKELTEQVLKNVASDIGK